MERRLITPAEAALLLAPSGRTAPQCIQAGLLSLLDAGRIELAKGGTPLAPAALVLVSGGVHDALPAHIETLGRALALNSRGTRLDGSQVINALRRAFGMSYRQYVHADVAPSLIKRGLLDRVDDKWLGLFPRTRYLRTPAGEALVAPLQRLTLEIDSLPSLIERDPAAAMRLARSAGVLLIMSPKARRQLPALRKLLAEQRDADGYLAYVAIDSGPEEEKVGRMLDIGDMALEFDMLSLLDSIDAVGDLTGGGDGGSDGGGSDGGGGD